MIGKVSQIEQLNQLAQQAHLRHQVISSNIANLNTPLYQTKEVTFQQELGSASGVSPGEIKSMLKEVDGLTSRPDGNNVDLEREMSALTRNSLNFQTYNQLLASKMSMLRTAITGR